MKSSSIENSSQGSKWPDCLAIAGFLASLAAVLLAAFAGFGTRWGWWGFKDGLGYFRDSPYVAGMGFILSAAALIWALAAKSKRGRFQSLLGLALSILIIGNFFNWLDQAKSVPPIHDITTDTATPPLFVDVLPLRKDALNPPEYGGPEIAEQQKKAYPDIQPLLLNVPADKAWQACLDAAVKMGWAIDGTQESQGRIEATDRTLWFGFKDDIVVRVLPRGTGSRVDVRSVSRVGKGDVGTNAKRIRKFLKQVTASVS